MPCCGGLLSSECEWFAVCAHVGNHPIVALKPGLQLAKITNGKQKDHIMSASDGKAATNSARPPRPPGSHSPRSLSPRSTSPRAGGKLSRADSGRLEGGHNPLYSGSDEEGSVQRSFFVRRPSVQLQQPIGNAAIAVSAVATAEPDESEQRQQQAPSGAAAGSGETSVDVQPKAADDDFVEHPQTVTFSDEPPPRRKVVQQHDEAEVYKHMGPAQKCWYLITKMRHPIKVRLGMLRQPIHTLQIGVSCHLTCHVRSHIHTMNRVADRTGMSLWSQSCCIV